MKILITGNGSIKSKRCAAQYASAKRFLDDIGFDAINPLKQRALCVTWEEFVGMNVELLLQCEGLYLLDGWRQSICATILYDVAKRVGKDIWHGSTNIRGWEVDYDYIAKIKAAIYEVTGFKFDTYTGKSRQRDKCYARMIFVYHCRKLKLSLYAIANLVNRDHSSIVHYLKQYVIDYKYDREFREWADRINEILKNNVLL